LKSEYGFAVPKGVELKVIEDTRSTSHLVLPPNPQLSVEEMRVVSGGIGGADEGLENPSGSTDSDWQDHPIFHD